jgi:hypothetical protein
MRRALLIIGVLALTACTNNAPAQLPPAEQPVAISEQCDGGLTVIRSFMTSHTGPLDDEAKEYLRVEANKAYEVCSVQEFRTFMKFELTPWAESLSAASTSTVGTTATSAANS